MKPIIILFFAVTISIKSFAQLNFTGFELWTTDTASFGYPPFLPVDTFSFPNPTGWTTSNAATAHDSLENKILTTQSNDALFGNSAVRMETDSLTVLGVGISIVVPGFVVNGKFPIDLTTLIQAGGEVNPAVLKGAGTPVNGKKEKLGIYVKYAPVPNDSLLIWAVLKKNGNLVAQAKFNSSQAYSQYTYLEIPFIYESCETPDSVAILLASSNPDFSIIGSANVGLVPGSVLLVDSIQLFDFVTLPDFQPIANNDVATTFRNVAVEIDALANDEDCEGTFSLTAITRNPVNGTASITNGKITYNPNNNFIGRDTIGYEITDGNNQKAEALIDISIFNVSSIKKYNHVNFSVFPNPSNNGQAVIVSEERIDNVVVIDVSGKVLKEYFVDYKLKELKINGLNTGIYLLMVTTENGKGIKKLIVE